MGTMMDGVKSRIAKTYCLSIKELYNKIGENLEYCTIQYTGDGLSEYFDLYNEKDEIIACMDGEEVTVIEDHGADIKLINNNGDYPIVFKLTFTEFKIAAFN